MSLGQVAVIAAHRFGLGARGDETAALGRDPREWLAAQLDGTPHILPPPSDLPASLDYLNEVPRRPKDLSLDDKKKIAQRAYSIYVAEVAYRLAAAIDTKASFRERLVWFWSNHFTVSSTNNRAIPFLGAFEREAIRPHVTGKFSELLKAAERHPAMLIYLDNVSNIGPTSRAGQLAQRGLNENLAREIMELHTLGVDGGYAQTDVTQFAKILTGWSVAQPDNRNGRAGENGFAYFPPRHEPGAKVLLGKTYGSDDGEQEGLTALDDLAHHPSTAHFVAAKLAKHFIADDPPPPSVKRLEDAFRDSGGDLKAVYRALIADPAAWQAGRPKMRTPLEYIAAVSRGLMPGISDELMAFAADALAGKVPIGELRGRKLGPGFGLVASARLMGQFPYDAPSPKGWPDDSAAWLAPNAVLERVEWSYQVGERMPANIAPTMIAQTLLGETLSADTRSAIELAASPAQGFALLVASPEFQRR